ncbi:MAG: cytochrome b561 [Glomeribacter sp. 1016415]|nr:cytochrome b561 [Glomeribacter sp. 1016415]
MTQTPALTTSDKYTSPAIALHWLTALLIICTFGLGWVMTDLPAGTPNKMQYYAWHKWLGVTVFMFAVLRVLWRATHRPPALPSQLPVWQRGAAHLVHFLLYLVMFAVPLSGYLLSSSAGAPVVYLGLVQLPALIDPAPALKPIFRTAHIYLNYALATLVLLHFLAALKHRFIDRNGVLARMLPWCKCK